AVPLIPVPAFVASYQSALAVNDLITAILLYSQFALLRSRALLLLASGYLFTAVAAVVHGLSFPGLFSPGGLLGAGPQTTAWLYMFWHGGFALLVIAYALMDRKTGAKPSVAASRIPFTIAIAVTAIVAAAAALTLLTTSGQTLLPA